jgi:tripartite-type tricarboxylate transporter receptor subunit TctC
LHSQVSRGRSPYPSQTIRIVVPFAPGGTSEIVARSVAAELATLLGVSVIVDNRAGGAGTIAMTEVAKAAPDGYTLILGHVGTLAVNPYAMARQSYDVNKDFVPIALLAKVPNIFVVNADVPAKDLKEFVALAKKNPGKLNYGSAGNGSAGHLAFEYLKYVTGIDVVHVPYRGTGPQLQDLLGGRLEAASAGTPALMAHIKSGKLRPIAVGTPERIPALPDVATVAEVGYPGFETSQWYGIIAPAGVSKEVIDKLSVGINQALKTNAIKTRFANDDAKAGGGTPADFAALIKAEQERWSKVVKAANIRIE